MMESTGINRGLARALATVFIVASLLANVAMASYAIPTAKLPNGDIVNLNNGMILNARVPGRHVSKATLDRLRQQRGRGPNGHRGYHTNNGS